MQDFAGVLLQFMFVAEEKSAALSFRCLTFGFFLTAKLNKCATTECGSVGQHKVPLKEKTAKTRLLQNDFHAIPLLVSTAPVYIKTWSDP